MTDKQNEEQKAQDEALQETNSKADAWVALVVILVAVATVAFFIYRPV